MELSSSDRQSGMAELVTTGARTFFGVPAAVDPASVTAQVAFLGVPFDGGTPQPGNRTGQKLGPAAARQASWEQFAYGEGPAIGWYDIESDCDRLRGVTMVDVGDVVIQGADDHGNFARMREAASLISAQGSVLVAVGGDHSISFPLVAGVAAHRRLAMVHVDAHADFLEELDGSRLTGASQLRRIAELPDVAGVTALGRGHQHERRPQFAAIQPGGKSRATCLRLGLGWLRHDHRKPRRLHDSGTDTAGAHQLRGDPESGRRIVGRRRRGRRSPDQSDRLRRHER